MSRFAERVLGLTAVIVLPVVLRALSLPAVLALCDRWPMTGGPRYAGAALAHRVRRWMAHGRGLSASTCLTRSLVLYAMLRQHGHRPRFHVGVAGREASFVAHAWVTLEGLTLGDPPTSADCYTCLLSHGA